MCFHGPRIIYIYGSESATIHLYEGLLYTRNLEPGACSDRESTRLDTTEEEHNSPQTLAVTSLSFAQF